MGSLVLSGYALCWNEKAFIEKEWHNRFYEQFQRGAFTETIKTRQQKVLLFHKRIYEIGFENLTFLEDEIGLAFRIDLLNNSDGRLAYNFVKNGDIRHVSIGFGNAKYESNKKHRHFPFHLVTRADLEEISLVISPAYKTSSIHTGCNNTRLNLLAEIEKIIS